MEHARSDDLEVYVTRDGSTIREWAGPGYAAEAANLSLAEATVAPGGATIEHLHRRSEELYLVTAGSGRLRVGEEERRRGRAKSVAPGGWAAKRPPASLSDLNDSFRLSRFGPPPRIRAFCGPSQAH